MRTIRITGTGSALPGRIVTNKELEQMVETSDEWIRAVSYTHLEYGALAAAGVMELPDLFRIIRMRGIYMQEAYPEGGAMAAILGLDGDTVAKICGQTAKETGKVVSVANYNCPGQIVITGEADAVAAASEALKEAGAKRCVPLKVSGPFHSALLKTAGEQLAEELKSVKLSTPWIPYVSNVTADYVTDASPVSYTHL